ncbi:hypothetical protein QE152_g27371 [Popillia japonica]|uniref:Uncharacterized protein n=1 Tax=Popillia japonica TaxID=7064 RepID=A0AAW1JWE6_POPJA
MQQACIVTTAHLQNLKWNLKTKVCNEDVSDTFMNEFGIQIFSCSFAYKVIQYIHRPEPKCLAVNTPPITHSEAWSLFFTEEILNEILDQNEKITGAILYLWISG